MTLDSTKPDFELEERYCEIAARRMEQEALPLAPRAEEPEQGALQVVDAMEIPR